MLHSKKRLLSVALCMVLISGAFSVESWATSIPEDMTESDIPEAIAEIMDLEGYVGISDDLSESLTNVVFEKEDGSRVLYMYDAPIKYQDETGDILFKTDKAVKTDKKDVNGQAIYAYENPDNDCKVYLPKHIKDGILTEKDGYKLEVFPELDKNSKAKQVGQDGGTSIVEYRQAFGKATHLQYIYTLNGFKENIVLDSYTGKNTFRFALDTHGLVPQELEGHIIVLEDPATGEGIFVFDQLDAEDADYSETLHYSDISYNNFYRIEPDPMYEEGSFRYILTAVIDEEFLTADTTQYPVTIDPPTYWYYGTMDTSVFADSTACYNGATMDYVGYHPSLGQSYKLAQCDASGLKFINPNRITKASYYAYITGAPAGWNMTLAVPAVEWTTDTVKYRDVNNNYRTIGNYRLTNSTEVLKSFDITDVTKNWLKAEMQEESSYTSRRGIMFMPGSDCPVNSYRLFYSANAVNSQKPAVVVEYTADYSLAAGTYFIKNFACDRYLDVYYANTASGSGTNICNFNGNDNQRWIVERVTSSSDGYYFIRPAHASSMYLTASDVNGSRLTISTQKMPWRIIQNSDGSYRLMPGATVRQAAESAGGNTADGTIAQTWGYGGYPNQKWVFQEATQLGGAGNYRTNNSKYVNCLGYALELNVWVNPAMNYGETVDTVYNRVVTEAKKYGKICRKLSSKDAYLRPYEYKVAMRVGSHNGNFDYHFMVQVKQNGWAHKRGQTPSEFLGAINPSTYNWGSLYGVSNFYDSSTLYFAVTR